MEQDSGLESPSSTSHPKDLTGPGGDKCLPGGVQGRQINSTLQHGLEPQGQGKGNFGWEVGRERG